MEEENKRKRSRPPLPPIPHGGNELAARVLATHELLAEMVSSLYARGADAELLAAAAIHLDAGMLSVNRSTQKLTTERKKHEHD